MRRACKSRVELLLWNFPSHPKRKGGWSHKTATTQPYLGEGKKRRENRASSAEEEKSRRIGTGQNHVLSHEQNQPRPRPPGRLRASNRQPVPARPTASMAGCRLGGRGRFAKQRSSQGTFRPHRPAHRTPQQLPSLGSRAALGRTRTRSGCLSGRSVI
jgi:hypothetical protein